MKRLVVAVAVLLVAAGCGGEGITGALTGTGKVSAPTLTLPTQVVGLRVKQENVSKKLKGVDRPYVDSVAVFSLRDEDLLRGTLQMARFNRLARPRDSKFRGSIVNIVGGRRPVRTRVGETYVYSTTSTEQNIFSWFKGRGFFILSVRQDFPFPRTLLRRVLDLELEL